jgi:hypothetical protein
VQPTDEGPHTPGPARSWSESWYFDFATAEGVGGYVCLSLRPSARRAWYWACLVQPGAGPVVVRDHDVAAPRGSLLEIRADGLWAECVCETPLDHWSLGLEAFGVRLDDPLDAFRGELGERLPLGHDLSWEATVDAFEPASAPCDGRGYVQAGNVQGEVLLGRDRIAIDGTGHRAHSWGASDWRTGGWRWAGISTDDGGALSVTALPHDRAYGARWPAAGAPVEIADAHATDDRLSVDGTSFDIELLGAAPLSFDTDDGDPGRLWRALYRFRGAASSGVGWLARVMTITEEQ